MKYQSKKKVIKGLLNSYRNDIDPFITDSKKKFPSLHYSFGIIGRFRELLFPNYWNCGPITQSINVATLETKINELGQMLYNEISQYLSSGDNITYIIDDVLDKLPDIRETLKKDVEAAFLGDPAARNYIEIIRSYPGFNAILVQRVAHVLYKHNVPAYPRELTENIHSLTGIDIHPGAKIGEYFFIDHGTGVVIGETAEIGDWVRIYQSVTLGILHFKEIVDKYLKKGYKRHPTIGSHVVIGAGTKILGPVIIGDHVNIGANSWIQEDIPSKATVYISEHPRLVIKTNER